LFEEYKQSLNRKQIEGFVFGNEPEAIGDLSEQTIDSLKKNVPGVFEYLEELEKSGIKINDNILKPVQDHLEKREAIIPGDED